METLVPAVKPGGRPSKHDRRHILKGILYQVRSGYSWRNLPDEYPPWKIVHHYYRTWREDGSLGPIREALAGPEARAPELAAVSAAAWASPG